MSDDAMTLFNAMRPQPPALSDDIRLTPRRPVQTVGGSRDLHDLAMVPGSPGYRQRIPPPPCTRCGEDHFPNREYDHPWTPEQVAPVHDEPVAASPAFRRPTVVDVAPSAALLRVALYVGRGDTYVVAVEAAPDWDTVESWRVPDSGVLSLINMARALGVKIADKTGGDLVMLEEQSARQYAQDHGRGPEAYGGRRPRRPGSAPDWAPEDRTLGSEQSDAGLPFPGGERADSTG